MQSRKVAELVFSGSEVVIGRMEMLAGLKSFPLGVLRSLQKAARSLLAVEVGSKVANLNVM